MKVELNFKVNSKAQRTHKVENVFVTIPNLHQNSHLHAFNLISKRIISNILLLHACILICKYPSIHEQLSFHYKWSWHLGVNGQHLLKI